MATEEQMKHFDEMMGALSFEEGEKLIEQMSDMNPDKVAFSGLFVDALLDSITLGYVRYDRKIPIIDKTDHDILERQNKILDSWFIDAFLAFSEHRNEVCLKYITQWLRHEVTEEHPYSENDFVYGIINPFKNAFPGFYDEIRKNLDEIPCGQRVKELCVAIGIYYQSEDPDNMADAMIPMVQKYPNSVIANTLLGYAYYCAKRWGSAVAYFERVEDADFRCLFFLDDIYFFKGWAYSKIREHQNAVENYRKALEVFPGKPDAMNNIGYEYYRMKQYLKAIEVFRQCITERRDLRFAVNNMVRTLLATKRFADAKEFIKNPPAKVAAELIRRVESVESVNYKPVQPNCQQDEAMACSDSAVERKLTKKHVDQFSSEKLLEDELELRIESGVPVFGKQLKIYRRHGEYGRQYIIPIGRLDLLAEDGEGNLYIIELKKDGGYDDAYAQTAAYLDWFEHNKKPKGKQIYGIICLNNPTEKLKEAVRRDKRVKLYHYQIAYEEVK